MIVWSFVKKYYRMDNNSIKHNLRHFRVRRKVTQKEMADQLGMTRSNYLCIENGDTRLISETIDKFAAVGGGECGGGVAGV